MPNTEAIKVTEWRRLDTIRNEWKREMWPRANDVSFMLDLIYKLAKEMDETVETDPKPTKPEKIVVNYKTTGRVIEYEDSTDLSRQKRLFTSKLPLTQTESHIE